MFELLQKEFEITILKQTVKYKQLTYYECLELHYLIQKDFDLYERCYNFLKDKISISKKDILNIDVKKFFQTYLDTACRWFYDKKTKWTWESMPFEAFIAFISKELWLDPLDMIKKYTPEAFNFILAWVIYNLNSQTKEWQRKNKLANIKKSNNMSDEDVIQKVKEMREKRNLLNNK